MKISVNVSSGDGDARADFVDDMGQMGFEHITPGNMFEVDTLEFEACSFDAAEVELTIATYFDHDNYEELD